MLNIFAGNLPYGAEEDELKAMFAEYGIVRSCSIIREKGSGRSKGYAFIEMEDDEQARSAIAGLNESEFGGRKLLVSEARNREGKPPTRSSRQS